MWKKTGTLIYSGAGLNSFMYPLDAVLNICYIDLFAVFFAIVLLVGIGVGSITFCLSSRSSNVIAMLMKVICKLDDSVDERHGFNYLDK